MLVGRVIYGNFFGSTKRRSGRKGCRDVVGAVIVVNRVETTIKENIIEIPRFLVQDIRSLQENTDNGTRTRLCQLKVIITVSGGMSDTVGGRVDETVRLEQLKFGMFLFGVGVGFGEIREVSRGDGMRKGCVQFLEGDDSSIGILDAEFGNPNVDNPAML